MIHFIQIRLDHTPDRAERERKNGKINEIMFRIIWMAYFYAIKGNIIT